MQILLALAAAGHRQAGSARISTRALAVPRGICRRLGAVTAAWALPLGGMAAPAPQEWAVRQRLQLLRHRAVPQQVDMASLRCHHGEAQKAQRLAPREAPLALREERAPRPQHQPPAMGHPGLNAEATRQATIRRPPDVAAP